MPDLADVRYFVDEDLAGVGLGLMQVRNDVVVGSHGPIAALIPRKDRDWIPEVARRNWVVITNDKKIRTRPHEAPLAVAHGLKVAHLAPPDKDPNRWDFVRLLANHWDAVEELHGKDGPLWLALTKRSPTYLDYKPGAAPRMPTPSPRPNSGSLP